MPAFSSKTKPPRFSKEMKIGWTYALAFHLFAFSLFSIAVFKTPPLPAPSVIVESIKEEALSLSESKDYESPLITLLKNPPHIAFADPLLFFDDTPELPPTILYEPPLFESSLPETHQPLSLRFFGTKQVALITPNEPLISKYPTTALLDIRLNSHEVIWFNWITKTTDESLNKEIENYIRRLRLQTDLANEFMIRGSLEFISR